MAQPRAAEPQPFRSEWIEEIRGGSEQAFEKLFNTFAPGLCAFLTRYVGSQAVAEDLVQDLFLTLWRRRAELHIEGAVSTYLLRAAKNRAQNHLRSVRVTEKFRLAHLHNVDERSVEAELLSTLDLQEAIEKLPPRCRLVFTMCRQQGYTYQKIADELGLSVKTVDTQMQRAMKALRARLHPFTA
jgi:RNA polymerase sigma-70 factor (ECF subfamily)